ncbi:MAG: DUF3429 family protein [Pseudomonadota bacterium]|nr:DUF3429 family protein [Pseudomonadota bacterium]
MNLHSLSLNHINYQTHIFPAVIVCLSALSCLPVVALSLVDITSFMGLQLIGLLYFSALLSFLSGALWGLALISKKLWPCQLSLLSFLLPWIMIGLKNRLEIEIETLWLLLCMAHLAILLADWLFMKWVYPMWYLASRTITTSVLAISTGVVIYRNIIL